MSESRTSVIVACAAAVAGSLWAPWYAIHFGPEARSAIGQQTGQLPGVLGDFARQMLTLIPTHIEATARQAFDKADVILFACAIVAVMAALIDRMDVAGLAGGAAACTVVLQMVDRPGPSEIVTLKWGAWLALAGALAIAGASRIGVEEGRRVAARAGLDEADRAVARIPRRSFAPF